MIDFNKYQQFVDGVTSTPSQDFDAYIYRLQELNGEGCKIADLQTAADGLCAEGGEFMEIVKKMVFQGCLLYTSPSPRDRQKSRMPSSA